MPKKGAGCWVLGASGALAYGDETANTQHLTPNTLSRQFLRLSDETFIQLLQSARC